MESIWSFGVPIFETHPYMVLKMLESKGMNNGPLSTTKRRDVFKRSESQQWIHLATLDVLPGGFNCNVVSCGAPQGPVSEDELFGSLLR